MNECKDQIEIDNNKTTSQKREEMLAKVLEDVKSGKEHNHPSNMINIAKRWENGEVVFTSDPNTKFNFACDLCGDCCRHCHDIILNAGDVYKISKYLNKHPKDWIHDACQFFFGPSSGMLIANIQLKLDSKGRSACFFLEEKPASSVNFYAENTLNDPNQTVFVCGIHGAKPGSCALYPVGRIFSFDKNSSSTSKEVEYMIQNPDCQNRLQHLQKEVSVFNFLGEFDTLNTSIEPRLLDIWNQFMSDYTAIKMPSVFAYLNRASEFYEVLFGNEMMEAMYYAPYDLGVLSMTDPDEIENCFKSTFAKAIEIAHNYGEGSETLNSYKRLVFMQLSLIHFLMNPKRINKFMTLKPNLPLMNLSEPMIVNEFQFKAFIMSNFNDDEILEMLNQTLTADKNVVTPQNL